MPELFKLENLKFNNNLYPRPDVDTSNITRIRNAIKAHRKKAAGTVSVASAAKALGIPPLLADRKTRTLVDGRHRKIALIKEDPDIKYDVEFENYKDDEAMMMEAVMINVKHGLPITGSARVTCIIKCQALGISPTDIAGIMNTTDIEINSAINGKIAKVTFPVAGYTSVALKPAMRKMFANQRLSGHQIETNSMLGGHRVTHLARQLTSMIGSDSIDWSDVRIVAALQELFSILKKQNLK